MMPPSFHDPPSHTLPIKHTIRLFFLSNLMQTLWELTGSAVGAKSAVYEVADAKFLQLQGLHANGGDLS